MSLISDAIFFLSRKKFNLCHTAPDQFFAEDSARIAQSGARLSRCTDLTLVAPLGPNRSEGYLKTYCEERACCYHIPLSTTNKDSVERNTMREVRYCAIAHGDAEGKKLHICIRLNR